MPIPRPDESESRDDYVDRCTAFLVAEGREADDAVAICNAKWESVDRENSLSADTVDKFLLEAMPRRHNQFRKDAIREGEFLNSNTGQPLLITRERLEAWAANFHAMRKNGVNVPIADGHDTSKPLGSIVNMMVVDDEDGLARLVCDYDFADEEAVKIAKRAKYVSIATDPEYVDCEDNNYGEVIQHVAVTATPVITRQNEYVQLSRKDGEQLEMEKEEKEAEMDLLREFAEILGIEIGDDMDESALKKAVMDEVAKLREDDEPESEEDEVVEEPTAEVVEDAEEPAAAEEEVVEEVVEEVAEPVAASLSREMAEALAESAETRIERLVSEGRVTPAAGRELRLSFIGSDLDNINVLTLSKGGAERSIVNQIIDILAKNDPVELGRKTVKQIVEGGERIVKSAEVSEAERVELERRRIEESMKEVLSR